MKIKSRTKNGTEVELSAQFCNGIQAKIEFDHPSGHVITWGRWGVLEGNEGIIADVEIEGKNHRACFTVPKTDYNTVINAYRDDEKKKDAGRRDKALAECPNDHILATQNWSNGDLCSAEYVTEDGIVLLHTDLLENHYGYYFIPKEDIEKARKQKGEQAEKKRIEEQEEKNRQEGIFAEAKRTGEKQILRKSVTNGCSQNMDDCSFDQVIIWALPDGTTSESYLHCH